MARALVAAAASTHTTYITTLPCAPVTVLHAGVTYFNCATTWYQQAHAGGEVTYIVVEAPPGH